ncbi:VOC family protein [Rhodococcus sp. LB1]|uniref:VOC family protein n=1 Tax=Rhodococcus sp. LB1 TaxID=1807499 RepID=UPI00077A7C07|nr:VOC family protein [Rhodococcus sp. LB1]KXX59549.1 hypothetical protein AZG88_07305 [Rhodococcus sp. LB1]
MKFHHVALFVSNLDTALKLWVDVLDFKVVARGVIPTPATSDDARIEASALDDIFGVKGAKSHFALLKSVGNALIELQEPIIPAIIATPRENLRYGHTGIHEVAFLVDDAQEWFDRVKAAGYEMQTDYVWPWAGNGKSFLFYDADGNMIQFNQQASGSTPAWRS